MASGRGAVQEVSTEEGATIPVGIMKGACNYFSCCSCGGVGCVPLFADTLLATDGGDPVYKADGEYPPWLFEILVRMRAWQGFVAQLASCPAVRACPAMLTARCVAGRGGIDWSGVGNEGAREHDSA